MSTVADTRSLQARLGHGTKWALLSTLFTQGATLAANIMVARIVGQEQFGRFAIVLSTLLGVSMVAQLGLGATATRYVAEYRATDTGRAGRFIGLLTIVSVSMALIAGASVALAAMPFAQSLIDAPELTTMLRVGAVSVVFATLAGVRAGVLAGFEAYRSLARATAISGCIYVAAAIAGAAWNGVFGAVVALGVGAAAQFAVLEYCQRKEAAALGINVTYRDTWGELQSIGNYAVPAALAGYISIPALWWGNAVLARQDDGFASLALYNAAWSLRTIVLVLPLTINRVAGSILFNQEGSGDGNGFRRVFWVNMLLCVGVVVIGSLAVAAVNGPLLAVYGDAFRAATPVLYLLLLSGLIEAAGVATYQLVQVQKRMWLSMTVIALPSYGVFVAAAMAIVPAHGAVGLGYSSVACQLVMLATTSLVATRGGTVLQAWAPASPRLVTGASGQ